MGRQCNRRNWPVVFDMLTNIFDKLIWGDFSRITFLITLNPLLGI